MSLALLAVSKLFHIRRQVLGSFGLPVVTLSVSLPVLHSISGHSQAMTMP
jgi:hypothetical protein